MSGLRWKLNRLRTMGAPEIAHRVHEAVRRRSERMGFGRARPPEPAGQSTAAWLADPRPAVDTAAYVAAADRILAGRFDVFAMRDVDLGFPPDWHRDPRTGTTAPRAYGPAIDYRDERIVGDIKYLWEPNRHLELVTLAQAWALTRDERYAQGCRKLLESWWEACAYPSGVQWASALELGIRLQNWSVAWQLLGGEDSPLHQGPAGQAWRRRWLDAVYCHAHHVERHLSRHSSANNHLLGELMGLAVAGWTWPLWPDARRWRATAERQFVEEALRQNAPDGVNLEQGIWYHHEVADMMLLFMRQGAACGFDVGPAYQARWTAMLEFIAATMDAGGHVPSIGDADDAVMVRFDPRETFDAYRSLLASGAVLLERPDFAARAGECDDKTRWLLGDAACARFDALRAAHRPAVPRQAFPDGGYWILGSDWETRDEVRIVADAGPLGYLSIAAHGHADALALTISAGGQPMLIDPGTYAYHTHKRWRDYFRGTSAHNTVAVDGLDQSTIGGNFMWMQHAEARCERWEPGPDRTVWTAVHDGFRRLSDPVTHRRTLTWDRVRRTLEVLDELICDGAHDAAWFWHFDAGCAVTLEADLLTATRQGRTLTLQVPTGMHDVALVSGRDDPPLGWQSPSFDSKHPCHTLTWRAAVNGSARWVTRIDLSRPSTHGQD